MDQNIQEFTSFIYNYYDTLIASIWILLPLAFFLNFLTRFSSKVSIFLIGFYGSYSLLIPYLLKIEQVNNLIQEYADFKVFIFFIISFIFGMIFYSIVKIAMSLGGFILGGLLGYNLGNFLISSNYEYLEQLPFDQEVLPWIGFIVIGAILALVISKNYNKIISGISILFGSVLLSFYTIYILEKFVGLELGGNQLLNELKNISDVEFYSLIIGFIIYAGLGFYALRKTNKE
ncbi:hypothetical protein [Geotoga petraea]|uniref:DUF4203 domain-containing protein n=1 Tax=Geotoga petraea TaxID=28234 RepID=A0A4Z0W1E5_9BACT|nr:hypothetical protein [Geotoga petraea]TGG87022.1 hypothetical protein E4650_09220 [Geotoga petraea]